MRLDPTDLRYLTPDEFRILTAVEMGSKNHEVVPTSLIAEISGVRGGNVNKLLGGLAKRNLVARVQNARYDGYRLTYGGLDFLALRAFSRRKPASVSSVGKKIGVGKESDIYVVKDDVQDSRVLKLHRLGRISFRAIKSKRDYLGKRKAASWMYMSRLAAQKEFAFMKALYSHGFPVPIPIDQARHCIVMSLIDSYPLRSIESVPDPGELYSQLMALIVDLAHAGLIHGDFNEFNILIRRKTYEPVVIDFPQMVSTRHENAEFFFNRDVNCIRRFFRRRLHFEGTSWPLWKDVLADLKADEEAEREEATLAEQDGAESGSVRDAPDDGAAGDNAANAAEEESASATAGAAPRKRIRIDLEVEASGFGRALQQELEEYMVDIQDMPDSEPEDGEEEEEEEDEGDDHDDELDVDAVAVAGTTTDEPTAPSEPFDEEAFQAQMAARMEALRLHKALGNDDPAEASDSDDGDAGVEYGSDSSSAVSDEAPQSDFTTYSRATSGRGRGRGGRGGAASRTGTMSGSGSGSVAGSSRGGAARKDDLRMQVARRVEKELGGVSAGTSGGGVGGQGKAKVKDKVGRAKGHKWKANPKHLVGGRGDGWD